jgi:hypothetical protein
LNEPALDFLPLDPALAKLMKAMYKPSLRVATVQDYEAAV